MPTLKKYCVSSSNKRRLLRDKDTSEALQSLPVLRGSHVGRPARCSIQNGTPSVVSERFIGCEATGSSVSPRILGNSLSLVCWLVGPPVEQMITSKLFWFRKISADNDKYFRWKLRWEMPFWVADEAAQGKEGACKCEECVCWGRRRTPRNHMRFRR